MTGQTDGEKKMHRKYLALAGVLSLVTVTAGGCKGSEEKDVKNIKIGVTLYSQYDTFISELMTEFTEYAADKEESSGVAIKLEILDASQSQLTQNEQVKNLIDKGCDVVCVNLVDRTEPTTITDLAENNQVPIIFLIVNWLQRIWNVGVNCIMWEQMLLSPVCWKEKLRQMHLRKMQILIKMVMVSASMWFWKVKPDIRIPL